MTKILVFMLLVQKGMATAVIANKENIMHQASAVTKALSINPAGEMAEASQPPNGLDAKRVEHTNFQQEEDPMRHKSLVTAVLSINPVGEVVETFHPKNVLDVKRLENNDLRQEQRQVNQEQSQAEQHRTMRRQREVRHLGINPTGEVMEASDLQVEERAERYSRLQNTQNETDQATVRSLLSHRQADATRGGCSGRVYLKSANGKYLSDRQSKSLGMRGSVDTWERWDISTSNGLVCFKSHFKQWLQARPPGPPTVRTTGICLAWEHWHVEDAGNGQVYIKSAKYNKYLNYDDPNNMNGKEKWTITTEHGQPTDCTRRRYVAPPQAKCSTMSDAICGPGKMQDSARGGDSCAADPCRNSDHKCCKATAKCSTITDIICGAKKIKDVAKVTESCASDTCASSDQKCCKDAESEDYYVANSNEACPKPIITSDECETAATELGGEWDGEESWDDRCYGCLVDIGSKVVFNTDEAGQCSNDDQDPVCKTQCPDIEDETKCTTDGACMWVGTCADLPIQKAGARGSSFFFCIVLLPCYIAWA